MNDLLKDSKNKIVGAINLIHCAIHVANDFLLTEEDKYEILFNSVLPDLVEMGIDPPWHDSVIHYSNQLEIEGYCSALEKELKKLKIAYKSLKDL